MKNKASIININSNLFKQFLLLSVSAFFVYNIIRSIKTTQVKLNDVSDLRENVRTLRSDYLKLYTLSVNMNSKEFLERTARENLNYAKDGDIIFLIPDEYLLSDAIDLEYKECIGNKDEQRNVFDEWKQILIRGL